MGRWPARSASWWVSCLAIGAALALMACSNDSSAGPYSESSGGEDVGEFASFTSGLFLSNASDRTLDLRIRRLAVGVSLDCVRVARNVGAFLDERHFGDVTHWQVPPTANIPLSGDVSDGGGDMGDKSDVRRCDAVLIDGDGLSSAIVFWRSDEFPARRIAGQLAATDELPIGGIRVRIDPVTGGFVYLGEPTSLLSVPEVLPRDPNADCRVDEAAKRVTWSEPVPWGLHDLVQAELGPDGCWALELSSRGKSGDRSPHPEHARWYLCLPGPPFEFSFSAGGQVTLKPGLGTSTDQKGVVQIDYVAPTDLEGDVEQASPTLLVFRGANLPSLPGPAIEIIDEGDCAYEVEARCGTARRPAAFMTTDTGGQSRLVRPGDPSLRLPASDGGFIDLDLMHLTRAIAVDPVCDPDHAAAGIHAEFVALIHAPMK